MSDGVRTPAAIAFLGFLVLVAIGSRELIAHGVPAIGTFGRWPGVGDLFDSFGSAWRYTGLGSASPAPRRSRSSARWAPCSSGAVGLAQTLTVVLALPLGAFGAYRLARHIIGLRGPALAAGLAYGINPVARNAIARGPPGPARAVRAVAVPAVARRPPRRPQRRPQGPASLRLAVLAALLGAWYPVGLGLFVLAVATLVLAVPIAGAGAHGAARVRDRDRCVRRRGMVLLFPWPLAYAHADVDQAALGFAFRPDLDLSQILRFDTGPSGAGWAMWGLVVAAAVPLFVATGDRLAWTARGWMLALVGWAIVWVPARFFPAHVGARARGRPHPGRARPRPRASASRCRCSSTASTRSSSVGANRR